MTSNQPDVEAPEGGETPEGEAEAPHPLAEFADSVAELVGGEAVITFDTVKVTVDRDRWVETLTKARDELDLVMFSFLSAIDWSNDPAVGDPLDEELSDETFEILATVGDVTEGRLVTFSTTIPHDTPSIPSLIDVYAGANWHEREAHEMFGIDFSGHPDLTPLYLPDGFLGHPLLKSFPLLSREVKPWPGTVDVEAMPEEEEDQGDDAADGDADEPGEADADADGPVDEEEEGT